MLMIESVTTSAIGNFRCVREPPPAASENVATSCPKLVLQKLMLLTSFSNKLSPTEWHMCGFCEGDP